MPRQEDYAAGGVHGALWTPQALRSGLVFMVDTGALPTLTVSGSQITAVAGQGAGSAAMNRMFVGPSLTTSGIGRLPCARFSGNTRLLSDSVTLTFPCVMTLTVTLNTGSGNRVLSFPSGGNADPASGTTAMIPMLLNATNDMRTYWGAFRCGPTAFPFDSPMVFSVYFSAGGTTTIEHYVNGAAGATGSMTSYPTGAGQFGVSLYATDGATGSGEQISGDWGSLTVYCADDAAAMRPRLEGWHAWRWGIQGSLAAGHPYRNAPPLIGG